MQSGTSGWGGAYLFLLILQTVASLVRYYARANIVKRLGLDDIFSFITLLFSYAYYACIVEVLKIAGSLDTADDIPEGNLFVDMQLFLAVIILYGIGTMFLKIAICTFLNTIFGVQRKQRIIIYTVLAINIGYGILYVFFSLFRCGSPANTEAKYIGLTAYCGYGSNVIALTYSQSVISTVSDVVLATLPISYLRTANMNRRTKWSVAGIIAFAFAGCIVSIIRIGFVHNLNAIPLPPPSYFASHTELDILEFYVTNGGIGLMSMAELCIGITCLAFTTYKPLFRAGTFGTNIDSATTPNRPPASFAPQELVERSTRQPRDLSDADSIVHSQFSAEAGSVSERKGFNGIDIAPVESRGGVVGDEQSSMQHAQIVQRTGDWGASALV